MQQLNSDLYYVMTSRARSALITTFWAASTMAVSSISYVATRMSGNLSDTMQEHAIASILTVSCL